VPEFVISKVVH